MNLSGRFPAPTVIPYFAFLLHPLVLEEYLPLLPCEVCAGGMTYWDDLINTWDLNSLLGSVFAFRRHLYLPHSSAFSCLNEVMTPNSAFLKDQEQ